MDRDGVAGDGDGDGADVKDEVGAIIAREGVAVGEMK